VFARCETCYFAPNICSSMPEPEKKAGALAQKTMVPSRGMRELRAAVLARQKADACCLHRERAIASTSGGTRSRPAVELNLHPLQYAGGMTSASPSSKKSPLAKIRHG